MLTFLTFIGGVFCGMAVVGLLVTWRVWRFWWGWINDHK